MKVKVYVKPSAEAQEKYYEQVIAEAYAENERLFQENRDLERQIVCMERDFQSMKKKHSDACADRDNMTASYKQVCASLGAALEKLSNAEAQIKKLESDLKTTAELRPKFSNLWQLLKDTGMLVDTEEGVHNHE